MTYVRKWNFFTHSYGDPEQLPAEWHTPMVADRMDEIINCACCGKEVAFGDCFTSRKIFGVNGIFGFPVCGDCYEKEWTEWIAAKIFEATEKSE